MKNKIATLISAAIVIYGSLFIPLALAQEPTDYQFDDDKSKMIDNATDKKAIIDDELDCLNSAQNKADLGKCDEDGNNSLLTLQLKSLQQALQNQ